MHYHGHPDEDGVWFLLRFLPHVVSEFTAALLIMDVNSHLDFRHSQARAEHNVLYFTQNGLLTEYSYKSVRVHVRSAALLYVS